MSDLSERKCVPCEDKNFPPLTRPQAEDFLQHVPQWKLNDSATEISRTFPFKDFATALAFADKIGEIAQEQWHHPELTVSWGSVQVKLTTHSIRGLSENDFIVAAHIDML